MPITSVLAVVPVADFAGAVSWYERLLGRSPDAFPMNGLADWQVTETGGIQVFHAADRAGTALVTLALDDLDEQTAQLAGRGLEPAATTATEQVRTATFHDPAGNAITFAESLSAGDGS